MNAAGATIVLIPGLFMTDWSTRHLRRHLTACGCVCTASGLGVNIGPTRWALRKLDRTVEKAAIDAQDKVFLVGHSLGGTMARLIASSRSNTVGGVITTCAPVRMPVRTVMAPALWVLHRVFTKDRDYEQSFAAGETPSVPILAIIAENDGILSPDACVQTETPDHINVTLSATHMTICSSAAAAETAANTISVWRRSLDGP